MISVFFFNDTATTEIYTLSLHDALPILVAALRADRDRALAAFNAGTDGFRDRDLYPSCIDAGTELFSAHPTLRGTNRSEEHTSELQSRQYLVCRLLLEKKKNQTHNLTIS